MILSSMLNLWLFLHQSDQFFREERKTKKSLWKKEKSSDAIKIDSDEFFPCGKKESLSLRLRKASAVVCQRKDVLAPFCQYKCQVEHYFALKRKEN